MTGFLLHSYEVRWGGRDEWDGWEARVRAAGDQGATRNSQEKPIYGEGGGKLISTSQLYQITGSISCAHRAILAATF